MAGLGWPFLLLSTNVGAEPPKHDRRATAAYDNAESPPIPAIGYSCSVQPYGPGYPDRAQIWDRSLIVSQAIHYPIL